MDRLTRITTGAAGALATAEVVEPLPQGGYRVRSAGRETIARASQGASFSPGERAVLANTGQGPVLLSSLGSRGSAPLEVRIHG